MAKKATEKTVDSKAIKHFLDMRHVGDISTPEALTGWGGSQRFDYWAMKPTWTVVDTIGYEIKVTRADFVGDKKWPEYLPFCNYFSFVCPHGMIQPEELPAEVGLLYCQRSGGLLYTKKKAPRREISTECLNQMLIHVLMWRYKARQQGLAGPEILRKLQENSELNYEIKKSIDSRVAREVGKTVEENKRLAEEIKALDGVKGWLTDNGLKWDGENHWQLRHELDEAASKIKNNGLDWDQVNAIKGAHHVLDELAEKFKIKLER